MSYKDDCISRRVAIEAIDEWFKKVRSHMSAYEYDSAYAQGEIDAYVTAIDTLKTLAPVQPDHNADVSKKVADEDCISRRVAIDSLHGYFDGMLETDTWSPCDVYGLIEILPSVQPKQVCVATVTLTDEQVKEVVEKAKNAVISVIEPESHWISCSERLPEEKQSVLVTDGSVVWVCDIISTDEGYKWEDSHGYWLDLDEWTAWMPIPAS